MHMNIYFGEWNFIGIDYTEPYKTQLAPALGETTMWRGEGLLYVKQQNLEWL